MTTQTLERLKKQQEIIQNRITLIENREKTKERKKETRRKILIGSYYLEKSRENNNFSKIQKIMDPFLTRDNDRILFDLSPLENFQSENKTNVTKKELQPA